MGETKRVKCSECPKIFVATKHNKLTCSEGCAKKRTKRLTDRERVNFLRRRRNRELRRDEGYKHYIKMFSEGAKPGAVSCLRCDRMFQSEDVTYNRLCEECKMSNTRYSPLAEEGLFSLSPFER